MSVYLQDITMEFPGTRALDRVDVVFDFNEVHGLVGENGAGKSTFVNILGGSLRPSVGSVCVDGQTVSFNSPREALSYGIAHVSQEGSLVPSLTGAENIMLGAEPTSLGGVIRRHQLRQTAEKLLEEWFPGLDLPLDKPVADLPMAERKVIEIIRALRGDIRLLILDEPTATLEAPEKKQLWEIISRLPQKGVGVVLISHFLSELIALSHKITVLRDGRCVATLDRDDVNESLLTDLMLRRDLDTQQKKPDRVASSNAARTTNRKKILEVKNWQTVTGCIDNFTLHEGEIVGLIGLTGAGHFGFARSLYTQQGVLSGSISIDGQHISSPNVRVMQRAGIAFIPDQRMENALAGDLSVVENLSVVHPQSAARSGVLNMRHERKQANQIIDLLNIKTPGPNQLIRNLSGGNKQKVSIGKWLYGASKPYRVMIFIEPTEGVDIGAKMEIYAHMRKLAKEGTAILIASSDLGEIAQICDRALPFVHGQPQPEIHLDDFSESRFIEAITGAQ